MLETKPTIRFLQRWRIIKILLKQKTSVLYKNVSEFFEPGRHSSSLEEEDVKTRVAKQLGMERSWAMYGETMSEYYVCKLRYEVSL